MLALALAALAIRALAAVSADEAKQLGTTLTAVGAEKAGNKDGTIPEYTGGLKEAPASFKKGSGIRPSPFESEKPRLVIDGKNAAQHADKLTEGTKELLKRYPTMRLDVYPTQRVVALPAKVLANTAKNAIGAKSVNGGLGVEGMLPGVPFPIPKTGAEAMWNHLVRLYGRRRTTRSTRTGTWTRRAWPRSPPRATSPTSSRCTTRSAPTTVAKETDPYFKLKLYYTGPARRAGEALMAIDSVNAIAQPRRAWQYLPGQRRVKLAPDLSYDTPNAGTAGTSTYSDAFVFNGALDRFDWKLVGKKEMYVPYNGYKLMYAKDLKPALTPNHVNPDYMRWELHRVWVVEGDAQAGPARSVQQARVLPRRGQLGRARRRPVRRQGAALSLDARQHDVQLRRERGEPGQLHVLRLLVGRVLGGRSRWA